MKIGFYEWSKTDEDTKARIMRRGQADIDHVIDQVKPIIERVKKEGDQALIDYAQQFDGCSLESLKVSEEEFEEAKATLDPDVKAAIDHCAKNVRVFHEEQMRRMEAEQQWMIEVESGIWAGEKITPISSVGLYVPGGKNLFPSVMYMLCIPATLAKVPTIAVTTPPQDNGKIGDALLYSAEVGGVKNVYKTGGAQAIAALAYGTETIPTVKKVLGPGSPYVAAAKQLLSGMIDPGMPAGPSESIVLCDESADPRNTVLDVLNEAEHGPDSVALLVTHDKTLAKYVHQYLPQEIKNLPEPQKGWIANNMQNYSGIILTDSEQASFDFVNEYGVEHLLVKMKDNQSAISHIHNAGEVIIGEECTISLANFGIGGNNVLPTGGNAHSYSCTSVWDFMKRVSLVKTDKVGFESLKEPVSKLCDYEGFPAHANAIRKRKI
ncbi:MAG: histidinol dehydrogenase [Pseudomonadota bacterium]